MHPALHYTLLDIGGSLWGTVVFASAMVAPGYVWGWGLNLFNFRRRSAAEQLAWSLALSLGIGTIVLVATAWIAGIGAAAAVQAIYSVAAVVIYFRSGKRFRRITFAHVLCLCWIVLVILSLVDVGHHTHLWMSVTSYDYSVRVPFVDAVMRTGVVPVNPLYWPGHDAPLRYYYFWYVICGSVAKLAHISARQALIASCVWPAFAVIAMLGLYGKYFLGWRDTQLSHHTRLAGAFMSVTGLDLLITIISRLAHGKPNGDMEWWSIDQVTSWIDTFLWVPHHAAALVCCLFTFLLFWMSRAERRQYKRIVCGIVAGLSFAGAFGLSTYVAIGFALVMTAWLARLLFTTRDRRHFTAIAIASVVAALVLAPYVAQLMHKGQGAGPSPRILAVEIREMLNPVMLDALPGMPALAASHPFAAREVEAFLLLIPGYVIELGFLAVILIRAFRLPNKSEGERTLLYLTCAALASVSFLRSTVIATNDYGVRASLLAQFFLLLLAARVWDTGHRSLLIVLAFIGLAGSVYQVSDLRSYLQWQQQRGNPLMRDLSERNYALRDAYAQLDPLIPRSSRLQYDPSVGGYFDYTHTLNANHQFVMAGPTCNIGFGGEQSACPPIHAAAYQLYTPDPTLTPTAAARLCRQIGADYLVATRWNAIWHQSSSWPWQLPAIVATPDVRIVACSVP